MLIHVTKAEAEFLRDLVQDKNRNLKEGVKDKSKDIVEVALNAIEENEKLIAYLDSKCPKDY